MEQVAHQTIVMQFILELAKSLKVDPRGCFRQFFAKIKVTTCFLMLQHLMVFQNLLHSYTKNERISSFISQTLFP